ncbi:hypothetical protein Bpfe_021352 [Biomphalaria pfeifferi]|uniref:Uncharacterized protein n=1 Tax=Biomphalaria pfeifferi TaxID=112525 RepID=A0AAD8B7C4_BIOPF|nr:hypothetical protein Bpfe_021352 [Biomphalaria pfeifferi]
MAGKQWLISFLTSYPEHSLRSPESTSAARAKAYLRAACLAIAVNGFEKKGSWPVNRNIFQDWEFKAAATTDVQVALNEIEEQEMNTTINLPTTSSSSNLGLGVREPPNKSWGPAVFSPFPAANYE